MPGPQEEQNLQMPHPQDWQGRQRPRNRPVGGGGGGTCAQLELTDALSRKNFDILDVKTAIPSWYFLSFSALARQIGTVGVKTKAFRFCYVSQKYSVKRDIKLLVAVDDVWDVNFSLLKLAIAKSDGSSLGGWGSPVKSDFVAG